jgi:hypothetical protein
MNPLLNRRTNAMRVNLKASLVLISILLMTPVAEAAGIDLHWLWDNRCAECHGHSGDFSRKFLNVSSGELQGRHHVYDLRRFMSNHYLTDGEVDAVYNMLLAQARNQARFKNECSSCHGTAAKLVRTTLEFRGGQLYSHVSGRPIRPFLDHHMGLNSDDVNFFMRLLTRVTHEVYQL